jgi:hypothetical protein
MEKKPILTAEEKIYIKRIKNENNIEPFDIINLWITLRDCQNVDVIQSYTKQFSIRQSYLPAKISGKINEQEMKDEILNAVYINFKKYFWELTFSNKYKSFPAVNNMVFLPDWYVSSDGNSNRLSHFVNDKFDEIIDFFNITYNCINTIDCYNNPQIDIEIIFNDIKTTIKKIKSL